MSAGTPQRAFDAADLALFAGTVLVWGTTWIALKFQLGTVDPQVSLLWRFLIAAPVMFVICRIAGLPLAFPLRTHLRFAAVGLFMFCLNFILFYNAGAFVVSGLLAVIFSLASVISIVLAMLFLKEPFRPRVALGALLGLAGVALLFSHEVTNTAFGIGALKGLGLGMVGALSFCLGSILSAGGQRAGVPVLSGSAWSMLYGVVGNFVAALVAGSAFAVEPTPRYLLALLWLAIPGTVVTFWMYLTLQARIGPDRAAYTAVLSPVLALLVSTLVEDFRWSAVAFAGLALVAAGNVLVLRRGRAAGTT